MPQSPPRADHVSHAPASAIRPTLATRLWFFWFVLVAGLATIPMSIIQAVTHRFRPTAHNFKRWATVWSRMILFGSGVHVTVEERTGLDPDRPYVFVANHQCLLDIMVLGGYLPYPFGFVAKIELAHVPLLGFAIRHSASLFIDRSDRRRSLESMREAGERIRSGNSVLIYAEGSRSYGATLQPLKKGAFYLAVEAGVPLVPVTVVDSYRLMNERRKAARPGRVRLVVGTPIDMTGRRRGDIPDVMDAVRTQMDRELAPEEQP